MLPKKGSKRKMANGNASTTNAAALPPPDRATWTGWVEVESEPAFFNVMLKDMGVQGVRVQELWSLEDEMLSILPQPVHALIFLFRYRDEAEAQEQKGTECPNHVWFANQIPDFACATVALLNIVNNIKGLKLGRQLREFKEFTKDMDPKDRGDAIDSFEFVKRIHNSFARENDLLNADMHCRAKANKMKKRKGALKSHESRKAKKEAQLKAAKPEDEEPDPDGQRSQKANGLAEPPTKGSTVNGDAHTSATPESSSKRKREEVSAIAGPGEPLSSPLSDPPESDAEYESPKKKAKTELEPAANDNRRRSARQPKPRKMKDSTPAASEKDDTADEDGFHFVAYMPIAGHVWRMDGLDSHPLDLGAFENGDWMSIAQLALQMRMMVHEGNEYNLMAVVHDPIITDKAALMESVKKLVEIEKKLDATVEDWRDLDGARPAEDVVIGFSTDYDVTEADIEGANIDEDFRAKLGKEDDLLKLVELHKEVATEQAPLRAAVRDARQVSKADEEKAFHQRHDYGTFVRTWLEELAKNELFARLLEDEG